MHTLNIHVPTYILGVSVHMNMCHACKTHTQHIRTHTQHIPAHTSTCMHRHTHRHTRACVLAAGAVAVLNYCVYSETAE